MTDTKSNQLEQLTKSRKEYIESLFKSGFVKSPEKVQIIAAVTSQETGDKQINVLQLPPLVMPESELEPSLESSIEAGSDLLSKMIERDGLQETINFMIYSYNTLNAIALGAEEFQVPENRTKEEMEKNLLMGFWMFAAYMDETAKGTGVIQILDTFMFLTPTIEYRHVDSE